MEEFRGPKNNLVGWIFFHLFQIFVGCGSRRCYGHEWALIDLIRGSTSERSHSKVFEVFRFHFHFSLFTFHFHFPLFTFRFPSRLFNRRQKKYSHFRRHLKMPWTKHIATYTEEIRAHSGSVEYWSCFLWETCSVGSKTFLVARKITVKNSGVFLQSECQTKNFQGESQIDHTRLFYIHSLRYTMAFQSFWNSPCKINFPFPENSVVCLSTFDSRCPIVPSDI